MSQTGSTTRTVGSLGSSTDSGGGSFTSHKRDLRNKQRKIVRILTVVAYILSVSTIALVLSAYYLFIWKPSPTDAMLPPNKGSKVVETPILHYSRQNLAFSNQHQKSKKRSNLPVPQSLVQSSEALEPLPLIDPTVWTTNTRTDPDQEDHKGRDKTTSTPQRAPASAPQTGEIVRTTPHLFKLITSATKSPTLPKQNPSQKSE